MATRLPPLRLHPVLRLVKLLRSIVATAAPGRPVGLASSGRWWRQVELLATLPSCGHSVSALLLPAIAAARPELHQVGLLHGVELLAGGHQAAELLRLVKLGLARSSCYRPSSCWPPGRAAEGCRVAGRWPPGGRVAAAGAAGAAPGLAGGRSTGSSRFAAPSWCRLSRGGLQGDNTAYHAQLCRCSLHPQRGVIPQRLRLVC